MCPHKHNLGLTDRQQLITLNLCVTVPFHHWENSKIQSTIYCCAPYGQTGPTGQWPRRSTSTHPKNVRCSKSPQQLWSYLVLKNFSVGPSQQNILAVTIVRTRTIPKKLRANQINSSGVTTSARIWKPDENTQNKPLSHDGFCITLRIVHQSKAAITSHWLRYYMSVRFT